jgi:hypothetical protein
VSSVGECSTAVIVTFAQATINGVSLFELRDDQTDSGNAHRARTALLRHTIFVSERPRDIALRAMNGEQLPTEYPGRAGRRGGLPTGSFVSEFCP